MGNSAAGRPRKPTQLKVLEGDRHKSRHRTPPTPAATLPVMPADMHAGAKRVWRRIMRDFGETGILTRVDLGMIRAYCEAEHRYTEAAVLLADSGPLSRDRHRGGAVVKNPLHQVVRDNAVLMRLFARECGFSPSSREGLTIPDAGTGDPFADWAANSG